MNQAGNVSVSVAANRASSAAGSRNLASNTSTAAYVPMTLDAVSVPAPVYNQAYSFGPFTVTNGTAPYTFNVSAGALPSGITLSPGGSLSGTTGQAGAFSFTARVVDANGRVATRPFSFNVAAPTITIAPATLPNGTFGVPYSETVSASGGATPYSYAVTAGALPTGLSLGTSSGTIQGTPTAAGTFNFSVTATDANGFTGTRAYTVATSATVPGAPQGVSVAVSGTTGTVTFSPPASDGGSALQNYTVTFNFSSTSVTFVAVASSPFSVNGLSYGVQYSVTVAARNAIGVGPASAPFVFTPQAAQTITFANPGTQNFGTTPTLTATASSGLPVSFASQTTGVCTISSGGQLTFLTAGTCTIQADQAGNAATAPAPTVTRSFTVSPIVPTAPLNPVATAGDTQALVSFSAPASNGGSLITSYTVTSSPDGIVANGASSPIPISGLTNGVSYTFTVRAENAAGPGPESAASNAVTPKASQTITFANPGAQQVGTTPTLTATAFSGLPVSFSSSTPGICTITPTGTLTLLAPGLCTIDADQPGDQAYLAAPTVSQTFEAILLAPDASNGAATVAANSANNVLTPTLGGGPTATLLVTTPPTHGSLIISGLTFLYTPTAGYSGSDSFAFAAQNATATSAPAAFSLTVTQPTLEIAPKLLPDGRVGTAYAQTLTADLGTAPYGFSQTGGTLPPGLTLTSGGGLTGTPTAAGTFSFTVTALDSLGATGSQTLSVAVAEQLPVAANSAVTVAANAGATPVPLALSGGPATGINLITTTSNGVLSVSGTSVTYQPLAGFSGTDGFTYIAINSGGASQEATVSITVTPPVLTISPSVLPQGRVGVPYSAALTADLGTAPYTFALGGGGLPAGLTLASDGTLSGTPTAAGAGTFTVQVSDANGATGGATLDITILEALPVAANSAMTVAANAGATPVPLALSGGPVDTIILSLAPLHGTATISGASVNYTPTPGYSGTDSFAYVAMNSGGSSGEAIVSITVTPPVLTVTPSTLPAARVGTAYSASFAADLGTGPYSFAVTAGALPAGLTLASDGTLSGTPTAAGSFGFTVTATDALGATGSVAATLAVDEEIPVAANSALTVAANAGATPVPLALSGGAATAVTITTAPLHGTATVSGTTISYTPAPGYSGTDSLAYTASNTGGVSAPATVSITVTPPVLTVAPPALPAARVGVAYTAGFTADLGTGPYSFAVTAGALPAGLTLAADGSVSGTPTAAGSFGFTVTATDALGASGSVAVTLLVDPAFDPVVPKSFTATVESEGTVTIDVAEGATGDVMGGQVLGVTPPEAGTAVILTPPAGRLAAPCRCGCSSPPRPDTLGRRGWTLS